MKEFDVRRAKLFDALPDNSLALVFAGSAKIRSEDENFPFFANRNFFYLTGIEQENSVLMLVKCPGERKEYLFLDEHNELKERWIEFIFTSNFSCASKNLFFILQIS